MGKNKKRFFIRIKDRETGKVLQFSSDNIEYDEYWQDRYRKIFNVKTTTFCSVTDNDNGGVSQK